MTTLRNPCGLCPFGPNPTSRSEHPWTLRGALVSYGVRMTATITFGLVSFAAGMLLVAALRW